MAKFTVCIPILNQFEAVEKYVGSFLDTAKGRFKLLLIDNGSDKKLADQKFIERWRHKSNFNCSEITIHRNEKNVGVYPTFKQGLDLTDTEWIFFSHSDVEMFEYGWDEHLTRLLSVLGSMNAGVCGIYGAKGIGVKDIYEVPYHFAQLMRWECRTVPRMIDGGMDKPFDGEYERILVLDGFVLVVRRSMIDAVGGFDHEKYPVHHMYDSRICLRSHFAGYTNWVLNIDCRHHTGITSNRENYAEKMGTTDLKNHREAHKIFYDEYKGKLPAWV